MRKQKRALRERKSRDAKRKLLRLTREKLVATINQKVRSLTAHVRIVAVRRPKELETVIGVERGLFGHPSSVLIRVSDEHVVGCVENLQDLAGLVTKVGALVLSQITGHNLAEGVDGLAKSLARWAGIDLEALKRAAEEDQEGAPGKPSEPEGLTPTELTPSEGAAL